MQPRTKYIEKKIMDYLKSSREHPTAKIIYNYVKKDSAHVAFSTIYRLLDFLLKQHRIRQLQINGEDEKRYDYITKPHAHFKCLRCGKVYDMEIPIMENLKDLVDVKEGHYVMDEDLVFYGICKYCLVHTDIDEYEEGK